MNEALNHSAQPQWFLFFSVNPTLCKCHLNYWDGFIKEIAQHIVKYISFLSES